MKHRSFAYCRTLLRILVLSLAALLLSACGKVDGPTDSSGDSPSLPEITFKGPNTTSQDPYAQMAISYAGMFTGFSSMWLAYAALPSQRDGNTWRWVYTYGTLTQTVTTTKQADGSYSWRISFNGTSEGTTYSNWTFWEGTTSADGKAGSWKAYEENSTVLALEFVWTTNASNEKTGTWKAYQSGSVSGRIEIVNNPNGSGEIKYYSGSILVYRSVWQTNGSGEWWTYDSTTGTQTGTGTWT